MENKIELSEEIVLELDALMITFPKFESYDKLIGALIEIYKDFLKENK